jgi:DNA-binding transcriptional MerR regulator
MKKGNLSSAELPDHLLLTSAEVIAFFRITYRTLMRWIEKHILIPVQYEDGGTLYFRRDDILRIAHL